MKQKYQEAGLEAVSASPEQFGELVRRDLARFGDVVRRAGIKVE
jgi:tripartite-type tricarboxylate transporter receptor subunit TctC